MIYIDIHNHSLFGVDDGAKTMEESLAMLSMAYEDGVREIILTPHAHYRRGRATQEEIREHVAQLQAAAKERFPELVLYQGNELYYDSAAADKVEYGEVCRLADTNYVLVEFSTEKSFSEIKRGLHEITCTGIIPVLAHVERYGCLYEKKGRVEELLEMGVYFQGNAGGVLGLHGKEEKKFLKKMLQKGMLHFIASDAHDTTERTPVLSECAAYVEKKYGEETMRDCFYGNPWRLLKNEMM